MGADQSLEGQGKGKESLVAKWSWCSSQDPFSKTANHTWTSYSEADNQIVEQAFLRKKEQVALGVYIVIFKRMMQIHSKDRFKQRPIRRELLKIDKNGIRTERFFSETPKVKLFQNESEPPYPYLVQEWMLKYKDILGYFKVDEYLNIVSDSKEVIKEVVDLAFQGIEEEANQQTCRDEGQNIVSQLRQQSDENFEETLKNFIIAYASETFLYKVVNKALTEEDIRKVNTLGPFCYLLNIILYEACNIHRPSALLYQGPVYRGAKISPSSLQEYKSFPEGSFISWNCFTSTTKNKHEAEQAGNILFIIELGGDSDAGYGADISKLSPLGSREQEVLLPAGSIYRIQKIEYQGEKPVVHLKRIERLGANLSKILYTFDNFDTEEDAHLKSRMLRRNEEWDVGDENFNTVKLYKQSRFVNRVVETTLMSSPPYNFSALPTNPQTFYFNKVVPISEDMAYVGEWNEVTRKPDGRGIIFWSNGRIYEGTIMNLNLKGIGRTFLEDGSIYEGEFESLIPTGKGKFIWGQLTPKFGDVYEGDIKGGLADGEATLKCSTGDVYHGQWIQGEQNGQGEMIYADGRRYKGDWVKGKRQGTGEYTWMSNRSYKGEFVSDFIMGKGVLTYPNGKTEEGTFEKGFLVNEHLVIQMAGSI